MITISELAEHLRVSVDTVRRWEKKGLIQSTRNEQNYRLFSVQAAQKLHDKLNGKNDVTHPFKVLRVSPSKRYTAIDLFAGAGGTALGLENAGFDHVLVNEYDKHAAETLRRNRPRWNVIEKDVHQVDFSGLRGTVDVVEGGFPCQAFSYAGKKRGFDDTRGTLFHEFARCVAEVRPKIAIGENVKGLLTHDGGKTLQVMIMVLQDLGYDVAYKVLRAQYFDVAQKRERLVIIAVRSDLKLPILYPREKDYTVSLKEALVGCPESEGMGYSPAKRAVMSLVPPGGYWRDLPEHIQKEYMMRSYYLGGGKTGMARRLSWDEPSLTLTCNPAQKQTERCHPEETRPLTVREYARIQAFPDGWQFSGSISQQYKQIGNAVPVNLGYYMGRAAYAMLHGQYAAEDFIVVSPQAPQKLTSENQKS